MKIRKFVGIICCLATAGQLATAAVVASKTQLNQVLGINVDQGCKAVFVKAADNCAYFVDFAQATPTEKKICDITPVASPLISPDGSMVTFESNGKVYAAKIEENTTPSEILTGFEPHWWIDPTDSKIYIVYCTVSGKMSWDSGMGLPGETNKQEIDKTTLSPIGSPINIIAHSFTGGLSKSGRYLCTAYTDVVLYDLVLGREFILNGRTQACNPSITPTTDTANENQMMMLTLGGLVDGVPYNMHEVFYILNRYDQVIWYTTSLPAGTDEWQKPEWSTHPDFAIATARRSGAYNIYISKIEMGTDALRVIDGDNTFPHLWVSTGSSITDRHNGALNPNPSLSFNPNPADREISLTLNHGAALLKGGALTLKVYTLQGDLLKSVVYNHPGKTLFLDTRSLSAGVYMVKLESGSGSVLSKIVIQ